MEYSSWPPSRKNIESLYRTLRNKLRKFSLLESLAVVQAYLQYLQFNLPLPTYIKANPNFLQATRPNKLVFEWELETLAKELILNAPAKGTRSLTAWSEFASVVDKLRACREINESEDFGRGIPLATRRI